MIKIALVIFSDTDSMEALGKVSNAFVMALEAIENGDKLKIIFEGAATKWIGVLEDEQHKMHGLYATVKPYITGVCRYCAKAFGVSAQVDAAGVAQIGEYKDHPSIRKLVVEGYQILTF